MHANRFRGIVAGLCVALSLAACLSLLPTSHGDEDPTRLSNSDCKLCGRAFAKEVARICSSCSSKAGSNCVLCDRSFAKEVMRICSSCSSKAGSNCVLCDRSFAKAVARICSNCSNK